MNENQIKFEYAWGWFKYHAQQRYSAFNYFLLVIGALAYAYILSNCHWQLKLAIGLLGLIISAAFLFIEKRNNELVCDGRKALDELENIGLLSFNEFKIRKNDENRKNLYLTHRFWFRSLMISAMVFSIVAIGYSLGEIFIFLAIIISFILILSIAFFEKLKNFVFKDRYCD